MAVMTVVQDEEEDEDPGQVGEALCASQRLQNPLIKE